MLLVKLEIHPFFPLIWVPTFVHYFQLCTKISFKDAYVVSQRGSISRMGEHIFQRAFFPWPFLSLPRDLRIKFHFFIVFLEIYDLGK